MSHTKKLAKHYRLIYFDVLTLTDVSIHRVRNIRGKLVNKYKRKGIKQAIKKFLLEQR